MTRKDFELIAAAIRGVDVERGTGMEQGVILTANAVADALVLTNVRFDRSKFLTACNVLDLNGK